MSEKIFITLLGYLNTLSEKRRGDQNKTKHVCYWFVNEQLHNFLCVILVEAKSRVSMV